MTGPLRSRNKMQTLPSARECGTVPMADLVSNNAFGLTVLVYCTLFIYIQAGHPPVMPEVVGLPSVRDSAGIRAFGRDVVGVAGTSLPQAMLPAPVMRSGPRATARAGHTHCYRRDFRRFRPTLRDP